MKQAVAVLLPVNRFLVAVQQRNLLLSDVAILLLDCQTKLKALSGNPFEKSMQLSIHHYFKDVFNPRSIFMLCTALDPRFKSKLALFLPQVSQRRELWQAAAEQVIANWPQEEVIEDSPHEGEDESSGDDLVSDYNGGNAVDRRARFQLRRYKKEKGISSQQDPLEWWRTMGKYPMVANYAAKVFSIQGTEVENERNFSSAGWLESCDLISIFSFSFRIDSDKDTKSNGKPIIASA